MWKTRRECGGSQVEARASSPKEVIRWSHKGLFLGRPLRSPVTVAPPTAAVAAATVVKNARRAFFCKVDGRSGVPRWWRFSNFGRQSRQDVGIAEGV
jgi:hypothetical protein